MAGMGIAQNRGNLSALGDSIFKVLGNDVIARIRLENLHLGRIVVDGIRYPEEIKRYSEIASFKLLAITADPGLRYGRAVRETEEFKDVGISREAFDSLVESRSELAVPDLMLKSHKVIRNDYDFESLKKEIDQTLKDWSL